jgi:hypothetical protein
LLSAGRRRNCAHRGHGFRPARLEHEWLQGRGDAQNAHFALAARLSAAFVDAIATERPRADDHPAQRMSSSETASVRLGPSARDSHRCLVVSVDSAIRTGAPC